MKKFNPPTYAKLQQIADALGVPVEHFFTDAPPSSLAVSAAECLRLWSKITTDEGRLQALEALRSIVETEQR